MFYIVYNKVLNCILRLPTLCTKSLPNKSVCSKQYIPSLLVMVIILKKPGCRQEGKRFLCRFPFLSDEKFSFPTTYVGEKRSGGLLKKIMGQDRSKSSISYLGSFPGREKKVEYALPDIKAEKLDQKKWAAQKNHVP